MWALFGFQFTPTNSKSKGIFEAIKELCGLGLKNRIITNMIRGDSRVKVIQEKALLLETNNALLKDDLIWCLKLLPTTKKDEADMAKESVLTNCLSYLIDV